MKNPALLTAFALTLLANVGAVHAANAESHGGRPPTAGTGVQGGTGSESMKEGTQIGAPGNIVTAAEGTVMTGHDADADGYISKSEAAKNGSLAKQFAKLDLNQDAKLDEKEFQTFTPDASAVTGNAPVHPKDAETKKMK